MKDFFVSYNKADRAWAEWIAWQLEETGYSTVIQAWDFRPGSNFVLEMHRAAQEAERTVAVLSPDYLQALYTQPEWTAAFAQDPMGGEQKLLPVRVRECELKGLLGQVIHIDLVGRGEDIARDELLKGVSSDRAKPDIPPSFPGAFPHSLSERPPFPAASASSASKVQASQGGITAGGDVTVTAQPGSTAFIQTGEGKIVITNTQGINPAEHQKLAKQLGVTEAALGNFFKILEQKEVPPEDLDNTLRTIAERYKDLQKKLGEVSSDDAAVVVKRQAKEALEAGDFNRVEKLLNEASTKDLEAARAMQERAKQRLLSAAASKAQNGDLKSTQLAYAEAAEYYHQAAELVPAGEEHTLVEYLNLQGKASLEGGHYVDAQQPFERALVLREQALGSNHPDLAQSLNNLAELYRTQGQYAKAEPLLKRALAIREKALGLKHPYVAIVLENYAELLRKLKRSTEAAPLEARAKAIQAAHKQ
jgi:tetratricopeptide (TPR) repeat protein